MIINMNSSEFYMEILDSQVKSSVMNCSVIGKNQLLYDNLTKAYLVNMNSGSLMMPRSSTKTLDIPKPVITFLIYIFSDKPFTLEFKVCDRFNVRKRIVFDSSKSVLTQFSYSKLPNRALVKDCWNFLSVDLGSIQQFCFEDSEFKCLESFQMHGSLYIRKIVASDYLINDLSILACDMSRVPCKTQDISKNFFLKTNSNSPVKLNDLKSSPKIIKNIKKEEKAPSYFFKMRSGELQSLKGDRDQFRSPQVMKIKKTEDFAERKFRIDKKINNLSGELVHGRLENRETPTYMLLGKIAEPLNYFQQFTSGLLKIRHETPPFVGSRGNIFYNPVQKQYDSL